MRILLILLVFGFCLQNTPAQSDHHEESFSPEEVRSLQEILSPGDYRKFQREDDYHERIELLRKVLERKQKLLRSQTQADRFKEASAILNDLRAVSYHALEDSKKETNVKELRHKEIKKLEIRLRKLVEEIDDLKLLVPLEERSDFEETREVLEHLRKHLLQQLFGEAFQSAEEFSGPFRQLPFYALAAGPTSSSAPQELLGLDRFTEEEFSKIQIAQKLKDRVEVFLEIAEHRLDEIERRRAGKEWDEEDPNPLEFHTYEDMLHAYTRAIDGVMINIDERARHRLESEKDIKKSLEELSEKIQEFVPRLQNLEALVVERKDRGLARKLEGALKTSAIAAKGAQYGLGAPAQK